MKIILLDKIQRLGEIGDVVEVNSGYARNFLIPQKKAAFASEKNIAEENTEALQAIDQYRLQNNQKISDVLNRLNALSREADEIEKELRRINSVLTEEETNE